jgi:N-alpha-acetyltransferase 10/11
VTLKSAKGEFSCTFRLATKGDIPSITSCNVMCLPENYSREYYKRHFKSWPTLAVVAENEDRKLIGYALGRVETVDKSEVESGLCGHVASIAVLEGYRGQGKIENHITF